MRFAAFTFGLVSLVFLAAVAYWVFITIQFPAGPVDVLIARSGQSWLGQGVIWLMIASLVLALVATLMSWQAIAARWGFASSSICWAVVFVLFSAGMIMKLQNVVPGTGLASALLNLLLVASPLLPLTVAQYLAAKARRLQVSP